MKKVLVTGATGMLGRYVHKMLQEHGYQVTAPGRDQCDLAKPQDINAYVQKVAPEAILHLAAETDVDLCERDPRRAGLCNHLATQAIAKAAAANGVWLLYVSTSGVFGGEGKMLSNEIDLPSPVNYYARSKLFGEQAIRTFCPDNSLIVRAAWMIGGGPERDHKFVGKIVKQIREGATQLRAVCDRFGTITPAERLAEFILLSLKTGRQGLFHYASQGVITRLDIARGIADIMSFKGPVDRVMSAEFPLSAPRALFEGIESIYLAGERDVPAPRLWKADLADYVSEFLK